MARYETVGRWFVGLVMVGATCAGSARADEVLLKNGDKLDGRIVTMDGGKLTINVLGLGDVKVDAGQIVTFQTDGPVDLRLSDGTGVKRKVDAVPTGGVTIEGGLAANEPVAVADISKINPPEPAWTGSILAGALLVRGNSDTDSVSLGVNLAHKTDQDDISVAASYLYGRTKDHTSGVVTTTEENWQVEARYDYNFTKTLYGFLDGQVRKDRIADLDLRVVPSGGLGYKFFDKPDFTLTTEAGLAWVYEKYTNDTPTREDVSLHLAYHLTKKFNDIVSAFHDLEYLPSLEHGDYFIVNTDLGLHLQLTKHLFGEAKITLDFDSEPANGAQKSNVYYALNAGYNL
jgi:putative salt-induced outer membrane protein YdiY